MTAPLVNPEVDLSRLPWFPIMRARLFNSSFNARASDTEWRAGVTLWIKSYDQHPTGSLPNDDAELWRLAAIKGNKRTWRRIKPMVLHGWVLCDDNRFYHPIIAELINGANIRQTLVETKGEHPQKRSARGELENKSPPKSPPRNGGDDLLINFDGLKPIDDSAWPRWLEDIYGPAPEGPIKRAAELKRMNGR